MSAYYMDTISRHTGAFHRTFQQAGSALSRRFSADAGRLWQVMLTWQSRDQQRRQLARMGARDLADMGISRASAAREAAKPFWRR